MAVEDAAVFGREIRGEETVESDEVKLLSEARQLLSGAVEALKLANEGSDKGRMASAEGFRQLSVEIASQLVQASIEVANAITKLKNSFGDEQRIVQMAQGIMQRARATKSIQIYAVESKALNSTLIHQKKIMNIIGVLDRIKEQLDSVSGLDMRNASANYYPLFNIRRSCRINLQTVVDEIDRYIDELKRVFKLLRKVEGVKKHPRWQFWRR